MTKYSKRFGFNMRNFINAVKPLFESENQDFLDNYRSVPVDELRVSGCYKRALEALDSLQKELIDKNHQEVEIIEKMIADLKPYAQKAVEITYKK